LRHEADTNPLVQFPLRERELSTGASVFATASGRFISASPNASDRIRARVPNPNDLAALSSRGLAISEVSPLAKISHDLQAQARATLASELDYLILVPTLRCNLSCSYCQVSRADIGRKGFDWSSETLDLVLKFIDTLTTSSIKIEFQGGEPTLRLDLIESVIARCERFEEKEFVICTNLHVIDDSLRRLLMRPDVSLSTSLDGSLKTHTKQRTGDLLASAAFLENLRAVQREFGHGKVAALPTIDQSDPPPVDELLDAFIEQGLTSIYLRPINYQGFARKRHPSSKDDHYQWWGYYYACVQRMIERNFSDRSTCLEEAYLSLCLRRIFRPGLDRHVDLRNPNPVGVDYIVVDFDGRIYPTDEARMLTRAGIVDLCIGDLVHGFDTEMRKLLDSHSTNHGDPACDACAYQPYCGRDLIDDLSRYGRIDLPRHETFFCQRHLHMFDLCMELIEADDAAVQFSLARWLGLRGDKLPLSGNLL
jgi:His-Xaa-Ser system radical SAM maturase HxsB